MAHRNHGLSVSCIQLGLQDYIVMRITYRLIVADRKQDNMIMDSNVYGIIMLLAL